MKRTRLWGAQVNVKWNAGKAKSRLRRLREGCYSSFGRLPFLCRLREREILQQMSSPATILSPWSVFSFVHLGTTVIPVRKIMIMIPQDFYLPKHWPIFSLVEYKGKDVMWITWSGLPQVEAGAVSVDNFRKKNCSTLSLSAPCVDTSNLLLDLKS